MDAHLEERFAAAFVELLKSELAQHRRVSVPELGEFHVAHQSSTFDERHDGTVVLTPPCERIVFTDHAAN